MRNNLLICFCVFPVFSFVSFAAADEENLLVDGSLVSSVDGIVSPGAQGQRWFFELSEDVNDYAATVGRGSTLELLPSSTLEQMIYDSRQRSEGHYRLWARVTRYQGENFLFPVYFIPLGRTKNVPPPVEIKKEPQELQLTEQKQAEQKQVRKKQDTEAETSLLEETQPVEVTPPNLPEDEVVIPQELMEKFREREPFQPVQMDKSKPPKKTEETEKEITAETGKGPEQKQKPPTVKTKTVQPDRILADRTAVLITGRDGKPRFVLDTLGWNVPQVSFRLLPGKALELTQTQQENAPGKMRFNIAGLVTEFQGELYLLLQRAARSYSHQNFSR